MGSEPLREAVETLRPHEAEADPDPLDLSRRLSRHPFSHPRERSYRRQDEVPEEEAEAQQEPAQSIVSRPSLRTRLRCLTCPISVLLRTSNRRIECRQLKSTCRARLPRRFLCAIPLSFLVPRTTPSRPFRRSRTCLRQRPTSLSRPSGSIQLETSRRRTPSILVRTSLDRTCATSTTPNRSSRLRRVESHTPSSVTRTRPRTENRSGRERGFRSPAATSTTMTQMRNNACWKNEGVVRNSNGGLSSGSSSLAPPRWASGSPRRNHTSRMNRLRTLNRVDASLGARM